MNKATLFFVAMLTLPSVSADRMPANTWIELTPDDCTGELCSAKHPEWRGYSGSSIGNGYIWWWGGGHKAGPTNDIDAYNISENKWEQFTTSENIHNTPHWDHLTAEQKTKQLNTWGSGRGPMYWSPLGRFMTHHSYQWQLWNPKRQKWCGLFPYPPKQNPVYVCYDPSKGDASGQPATSGTDPTQPDGAFEIISDSVPDWKTGRHTVGLTWDSKRHQVAMTSQARGTVGIWRYDSDRDEWYRITDRLPKGPKYNEGYIEYHPGEDTYYTSRKRQISRVDAETGIPQKIANPPAPLLTFSLEYSPELDRMLLGSTKDGVAHIYAYNPPANEWQKLLLDGNIPTDSTLGYDLLDRDPDTGQYFLIRDANSHNRKDGVYTFRLTPDVVDRTPAVCSVDHCVGHGYQYATLQAAVANSIPGDVIGLEDGHYEQCVIIDRPVTVRSLSGRPHLRDRICDTKGIVVINTTGTVTIEGIEVSGATDEKAIWQSAGKLTLRNVIVNNSGMGILAGPDATLTEIVDSEFYGMDDPNEKAHFIYGGESERLVVRNTYLHGGTDGHFIKAKSVHSTIEGNRIEQEAYTDINLIDVWACGENLVHNNHLTSFAVDDGVNAIGITGRTSEKKPCPVDTATFQAEGNTFIKNGEPRWSRFVDNRWTPGMPYKAVTLANNDVTGAIYYRDVERTFDTEADWIAARDGTTEPDPTGRTLYHRFRVSPTIITTSNLVHQMVFFGKQSLYRPFIDAELDHSQ